MNGFSQQHITSDLPKVRPEDDRLGYAPFAQRLADSLHALESPRGLVAAVYGPWGSGKSTLLNFVEYYLKQSDAEQILAVRFNPWWFSGHEDLASSFFEQLLAILDEVQHGEKELRRRIANFANAISDTGFPQAWLTKAVAYFIGPGNQNIPELKEEIEALLEKQRRILVIIDDIDRLTSEEISKPQRFPILKSAIEDGQALALVVDYVSDLGLEHGRLERTPLPESQQTVNTSELVELEKLAATKLREAGQDHGLDSQSLLQRPKLEHNLYRWRDWGGSNDIERWFEKLAYEISDDSQLSDAQIATLQRFAASREQHRTPQRSYARHASP